MGWRGGVNIWRLAATAIAVGLAWLSISTGVAGIARAVNPALALKFSSNDARAKATLADDLIKKGGDANRARAITLAQQSISRDATGAVAMRVLGFTSPPSLEAKRVFYAAKLSKRDPATQLWLIDDAVNRGDPRAALVHYDAALRTTASAPQILFPILARASEDATLVPDITKTLARQPGWANSFLYELVNSAPSADHLVTIFAGVKRAGTKIDPRLGQNLIDRTIRDKRFDLARQAYSIAGGADAATVGRGVQDGNFSGGTGWAPFDWVYSTDTAIVAERVAGDAAGKDMRLSIRADGDATADAARQLLTLSPGIYQLSALAGDPPEDGNGRIFWTIGCAASEGVILTEIPIAAAGPARQAHGGSFTIPAGNCSAQWLSLAVRTEAGADGFETWVDNVSVKRVR
jgi:hypothetical protein